MSKEIVAKRYALALFQLAKEQNILDEIGEELRVVKQVFTDNEQFLSVLHHPKVSVAKKKASLQEAFKSASSVVVNTLSLLVERHRLNIVVDVVNEFLSLSNDERGVADAKVFTVKPLSDVEKNTLSNVFATKVGKQSLNIENIVDHTLIGGIKIRIGNRIYDGSVSSKLERIERQLVGNRS
ncbi:F0F1 ATP synthase subunit delta [Cytobacillus sp. Hm23]|uniref:F0F1 ATP synthase subunit delta n=1 Tax=Cytobacillus sp. IB215665 TaxID=3097357 RepID=UPI002A0B5412|nr:F0F1 ATP synthase subunit delta [Cytobacillus sp. IB215665]MDX8363699.1 F0F1 ATP synthase subunit delta [Cytobacillus sp. IB215665]